jgi:hypothetical protein
MTAEDAEQAVALGVDGVWVSNHGGRQLDAAEGTASVLAEVVEAVDGRAKVCSRFHAECSPPPPPPARATRQDLLHACTVRGESAAT